jgi:hypothetical protein
MRKTDFISQLQCRLLELGCPLNQVRRLVGEVEDHRDDLNQAAFAEGLSGAEAEKRINERMGDPLALAEHQMVMVRRSSWLGRHSIISFCLLPVLLVPLLWVLSLAVELLLEFVFVFGCKQQELLATDKKAVQFYHLILMVNFADCLAMALVASLICWMARRLAIRPAWMLIACLICSLYGLSMWVHLKPHNFSVGFTDSWPPQMNFKDELQVFKAMLPLLIAGATCLLQWRTARRFRQNPTMV